MMNNGPLKRFRRYGVVLNMKLASFLPMYHLHALPSLSRHKLSPPKQQQHQLLIRSEAIRQDLQMN
jgi:hypothetical protein